MNRPFPISDRASSRALLGTRPPLVLPLGPSRRRLPRRPLASAHFVPFLPPQHSSSRLLPFAYTSRPLTPCPCPFHLVLPVSVVLLSPFVLPARVLSSASFFPVTRPFYEKPSHQAVVCLQAFMSSLLLSSFPVVFSPLVSDVRATRPISLASSFLTFSDPLHSVSLPRDFSVPRVQSNLPWSTPSHVPRLNFLN